MRFSSPLFAQNSLLVTRYNVTILPSYIQPASVSSTDKTNTRKKKAEHTCSDAL